MNNQARGCIYHLVSSCEMPCHVTQAGFYSHGGLEHPSFPPRHEILAEPNGKAIFSPLLPTAAGSAVNPPRLGDGFMLTREGSGCLSSDFGLVSSAMPSLSHFGLAPFVLTTPQSRLVEGGAHNHIQQKS